MHEVFTTIKNAEDKGAWFDKFVAIFSQSRAHYDLVERLKRCVYGDNGGSYVASYSYVGPFVVCRSHTFWRMVNC